ncbi:MAG: IclR family transcriptional regulator [Rhodospirillales bacterium]
MRTKAVKSAARVLDLLELLALMPQGMTLTELSNRLGIPKSSISALLATLTDRGYVELVQNRYFMARRLQGGDWVGKDQEMLLQLAKPDMRRLAETTGETAFLGVLTPNWQVQYVAKSVSSQPLRYDADLGVVRPAYSTSIGITILAGLDDNRIEAFFAATDLVAITEKTITDPNRLRAEIEIARRDGFVITSDSNVVGTSGVCAPIRNAAGQVIAGLAIIAPSARFTKLRGQGGRENTVQAVLDTAAGISRALAGYSRRGSGPLNEKADYNGE